MVSATPTSPHNKLYISSRILQVVLGITCFAIATHLKVDEWRWGYACDEQKGGCNSQEMWENYSGPGVVTINENSYSYIGPIGGAPGDRWDAVPNESQLAALIAAVRIHILAAAQVAVGYLEQ